MKMKKEHLDFLREALYPLDTYERRQAYINAGRSSMRYRWDLCYAAKLSQWISDNLYAYLNDSHIDTALRNLVADLEEPK